MFRLATVLIAFAFFAADAAATGQEVWRGGLWILDLPGDTSTYGHFRLVMEPDISQAGAQILRVEWIETLDGKGDRLFATRLVPELGGFVDPGLVKVESAAELPSAIRLQNARGKVLWLRVWEPTRIAVQDTLR
jgi:hypothetical protein